MIANIIGLGFISGGGIVVIPVEDPWEAVINLSGTTRVQATETSPVSGRVWNNTNAEPSIATLISPLVDVNGNTLEGTALRCQYSGSSATDGVSPSTIYPTNAAQGNYPAPSAGDIRSVEIDLPAGLYRIYTYSSSTTSNLRTNFTVKPNGGSATSEGTQVAVTGSNDSTELTFDNNGDGILLSTSGYIRVEWQRNTSAGGNFGRFNILRIVKVGEVGNPPSNLSLPEITGTIQEGQTLNVSQGTWSNSPSSYTYQWKRDTVNISGAISASYTLVNDDVGTDITCEVTASNLYGSNSATSTAVGPIEDIPTGVAPSNISAPVISGVPETGQLMSSTTGTWDGDPTITYGYQWLRNGANISGATSSTYTVQVADEGNTLVCRVTATNSEGSSSADSNGIYIEIPSLSTLTFNHAYNGSDKMLVYTPPGYYENEDNYPIIIFYHGDGQRGVPTDKNDLLGTGNGSQTVFSGSLTNTFRVLHTSPIIKVNGVQVAIGRNGVITGDGVTGTYNRDTDTSASFSVTFTTPPTNGHEIRMEYVQSKLFQINAPRFLNLGDEPGLNSVLDRCLIVCPQISRASGGFTDTEWDNVLDYMTTNFRVNTNRIYVTGFSLGGVMGNWCLQNANPGTNYTFAASVNVAPGADLYTPPSGDSTWNNALDKGKLFVRGTNDPNGTGNVPSTMFNGNDSRDANFPVQAKMYWNITHSGIADTYCYNRKFRTDAAGAADFDYIRWLLRFSLDALEQATLLTRYAEETETTEDYRIAKRAVDALSASAEKTALLADLATLKTTIGTWVLVNFANSFYSVPSPWNNVTSAAASTTVSNLIDDTAANTGFSITCVAAPAATPAIVTNLTRLRGGQFGFAPTQVGRTGHTIDAAGTTGTYTINNLNNAHTYTVKIYAATNQNTWSSRGEIEVTINSTTKYMYCALNNSEYLEFTGLTPSSGTITISIKTRQTTNTEAPSYLQAIEFKREL